MRTSIHKWGNSLALRIPKAFADEAKLAKDTPVELTLADGKVIISPIYSTIPTLDELVARVTKKNRHREWDTGRPVSREIIEP